MDTIKTQFFTAQDMTGTLVSPIMDLRNMNHLCVHCTWVGTPTGTLSLEVSAESTPTNFETVSNVAVAGAGSQMWLDRNAPYTHVRVRYVPTASTGTIESLGIAKGDL